MNKHRNKLLHSLKYTLILLSGNLLLAFLVNTFVLPSNIIMGGATGIGRL